MKTSTEIALILVLAAIGFVHILIDVVLILSWIIS